MKKWLGKVNRYWRGGLRTLDETLLVWHSVVVRLHLRHKGTPLTGSSSTEINRHVIQEVILDSRHREKAQRHVMKDEWDIKLMDISCDGVERSMYHKKKQDFCC